MPKSVFKPILLLLLAALAIAPLGCSDDDPVTPPPVTVTDTTAPMLVDYSPSDGRVSVSLDADVYVMFSEPMATGTGDANVTLTGATGLTWNTEGTVLAIAHADWAQGAMITLTLGTGLTDVAGNALPQAYSFSFYTWSSTPVLLDTNVPGTPGAVPCNTQPTFLFSEPMDLNSVVANISFDVAPPKALPAWQVGSLNNYYDVYVRFLTPLDPYTTYTITIGASTQTAGGGTLGTPAALTFTTGAGADETGPQIQSVTPAVGSVVPTDLDKVVITFTEPIADSDMRPNRMAALLEIFMSGEPAWNAAHDQMTLYLQHPLPAGVRLYAWYDDYGFYDLYGNGNAQPDSISFSTAGTASLFPVRDDLRLYYETSDMQSDMARQTLQNISGSNFERLFMLWNGSAFVDVEEHWYMSLTSSGLYLRGFDEDTGHATFDPPAALLTLPVQTEWSGTSNVTTGDGTVQFSYVATASGPYSERMSMKKREAPAYYAYLDGCYDVQIEYSMTVPGQASAFEMGELYLYLAPGLGLYAGEQYGAEYDGGTQTDQWESSYWLWGAALDDRWETPR